MSDQLIDNLLSLGKMYVANVSTENHPVALEQTVHYQAATKITRLTALIDKHNRGIESICLLVCGDPATTGQHDPGCPRHYMIDTQDGVK